MFFFFFSSRRRHTRLQGDWSSDVCSSDLLRVVDDADVDGRRAAVVGDALLVDQLPDPGGLDLAEADMGAGDGGDAPGKTPAVAVEHRERPEVLRVEAHVRLDHLADRVEPRATVRVHDTLGTARRARGVVDRDRLVLVVEPALDRIRRAGREELLVGIAHRAGIVDAHDPHARQVGRLHESLELVVHEKETRARVLEDVADLVRAEPRIDGDEDPAGGRHAEVCLEHRRDVRAEERDRVVLLHPRSAQRRGEAVHALLELRAAVAPAAVGDGGLLREDVRAAREEARRGELGAVDVAKLVAHHRVMITRSEKTALANPLERGYRRREEEVMSDLSRRDVLRTAGALGAAGALAGTASGQGRPSADDLIRTVKGARMFDLSFVWSEQSPILSLNPPYSFALNRTHKMTYEIFGQAPGSRVSWASEIMYFSGQHGAPTIDAIGHIGRALKLHAR